MNLAKANHHIVSDTTKPAKRSYIAEVQARVQDLSRNLDDTGNRHRDIRLIEKQHQQTPHVAATRSRTALSGKARASVVANAAAEPASRLMGFNPLHPSSELPPEQLLRLLKMASRNPGRRKRKRGDAVVEQKHQASNHGATQPRSKLFIYAALIGTLLGAIASSYLWWKYTPQTSTTPLVKQSTVIDTKPAPRKAPVSTKKPHTATAPPPIASDPEWQAAIQAERMRLLVEAESRLATSTIASLTSSE